MLPVAPLMIEHRLIERLIRRLGVEVERIRARQEVDPVFIERAVDFIRTYADRCHHGKEEDILFRDLARKPLSPEHARIMRELTEEHVQARGMVRALMEATQRHAQGDRSALESIAELLAQLAAFYPVHIKKEDRGFFVPVMAYFTKEEQAAMFAEFWEFDRQLIHEKYKQVVEELLA
ncbi:MAG TPA: hemerythrin domain-containing protein [Myxococcota bacterium]|nr:hemerythrin domain-containing protein [Myxococcota bacterium]HRY92195.1 hemerythrin domain-containing protein [Myxococcota bacterium]HSA21870.1 hemerythrin domain-containing protein [Myxococcota bacterium]